MADIFEIGPGGVSLCVDGEYLCAALTPSGNIEVYKTGPYGRSIYVDSAGRLLVTINAKDILKYIKKDISEQMPHTTFILDHIPRPNTLKVFYNGLLLKESIDGDYTTNGNIINMSYPINHSGSLIVEYFYGG